ncbi:MAG: TlyA family RNA methyltransferase [Desulfobacterota bacterium]|nr:TlyA family RNA methyltransferase [Thermodesulfobacteriota bacterium]MDW8001141.1 TlyA family RNA methyltransferase [Deltaproteobacteria bacterium]
MAKERLDVLLTNRRLAPSREKAKIMIVAGEVYVSGEKVTRPDRRFTPDVEIEVRKNPLKYVSFGGIKLEKALRQLNIDVKGKKAIDIGSSTGGFTDCLLKFGASYVLAVDVGKNQLHYSLRSDPRVGILEGVNARYLTYEMVGQLFDLATIDVSFISLKKILPNAIELVKTGGSILSLVKPQFEVGRFEVGKGGVVRDADKIKKVLEDIKAFAKELGLTFKGEVEAPRENEKKNREYFLLWEK